ncbi:hypothetical protein Q9966_013165 [Columba livia]|nr:hypothetical protein Q9966_013165 [Columba livia]
MASSQGKNELRFADWMAALPGSIHRTPLTNLAIPEEEYILLNHMHCDTYPRGTNICGGPLPAQSTSQDVCLKRAVYIPLQPRPFLKKCESERICCGEMIKELDNTTRNSGEEDGEMFPSIPRK